jgi:hypothetical protein
MNVFDIQCNRQPVSERNARSRCSPTFDRNTRRRSFLFFFFTSFVLQSRYQMVLRDDFESFVFLYPGLLCSFWMVYEVGVCLAGKAA